MSNDEFFQSDETILAALAGDEPSAQRISAFAAVDKNLSKAIPRLA